MVTNPYPTRHRLRLFDSRGRYPRAKCWQLNSKLSLPQRCAVNLGLGGRYVPLRRPATSGHRAVCVPPVCVSDASMADARELVGVVPLFAMRLSLAHGPPRRSKD
jgi:hypothetical protein